MGPGLVSQGAAGAARRASLIVAVCAAVALTLGNPAARTTVTRVSQPILTRYSLAHGCYTLRSTGGGEIGPGQGPLRMQPAALGIYLLYNANGDYVSGGGGAPQAVATPDASSEWRVDGSTARGFTITNVGTGAQQPVTFAPAAGCATYPEAQVDATGQAFAGATPEADVFGTVEGHAHITAFEFFGGDWHCGRPWDPFGAPYALPASCAADEQGTNGEVEDFLDWGGQPRPSDMHGWPTFVKWPGPTVLAEEGDYYTGLERAWKAGLRLAVTNLVDNEALCSLMTTRHNPCNDMAAVQIQSRDLYALQDYIDAQSGGPGRGWFRIVTDPFQARRVINEGKLAVIEGIEVSRLFGCGEYNGTPQCDQTQVDAGMKVVRRLGVRTFFPIHEFNNAFGGTKMIAGDQGALINAGNRLETGSFWTLQPCPAQDQDAEQVTVPGTGPVAGVLNGPVSSLAGGNPLPVYGPGPQCNTQGLTSLGAYLIHQMIRQHLIIQLDHMDSKTATAALTIAQAAHYSGVVSAHCCSSPQLFKGIYAAGGFITPPVEPTSAFVATWRSDRSVANPRYRYGFGWGSDENGLADQPGPQGTQISYPFKSYDGRVTFTREQWGDRKFDFNTDGLANYGMYADWLHQLQLEGGPALMADMFHGAEAYLEMWERAYGVPPTRCLPAHDRLTSRGLGSALRLRESSVTALYSAGQPLSRPGRSYRYCVSGNPRSVVVAVFNSRGRISLIASTAPGEWPSVGSHRGYVHGVSGGRVPYVAVAAPAELRDRAQLRSDLQAAGLAY